MDSEVDASSDGKVDTDSDVSNVGDIDIVIS